MHAYLLVLEIHPLAIGATYDSLPLHCTLVHWFWLQNSPEEVIAQLEMSLNDVEPMVLEAQEQRVFTGKTKQGVVSVTVNDIALTPGLRQLHERTCDLLENLGVRYSEPRYVRSGFHPHATHQKDGRLKSGDVCTSNTIYLVEANAPEYGNDRTVLAAIPLHSDSDLSSSK